MHTFFNWSTLYNINANSNILTVSSILFLNKATRRTLIIYYLHAHLLAVFFGENKTIQYTDETANLRNILWCAG